MIGEAVTSIQGIADAVEATSAIGVAIAGAMADRRAATAAIDRNAQEMALAAQAVTVTVDGVKQAASTTGLAASRVLTSAGNVARQAKRLSAGVRDFVAEVRVA